MARCSRSSSVAISLAVRPASALAPGLRWRRVGPTTCSIIETSRSAAVRTVRRCLACTP